MDLIHKHLGQAVQTITTRTAEPLPITNVDSYFNWSYTGAETAREREELFGMLAAAKTFCSDFLTQACEPYWLTLTGRSGCGKTFLAECIRTVWKDHAARIYEMHARPLLDPARSDPGYIWSYRQQGPFLRKWIRSVDAMRDGNYQRAAELSDDWCKIIDDFGAESMDREGKPTPFILGQMGKICDARLGKWTVITSNFSRKNLGERFDVRIASRLMRGGNICVHCDARDFNIRKQTIRQAA